MILFYFKSQKLKNELVLKKFVLFCWQFLSKPWQKCLSIDHGTIFWSYHPSPNPNERIALTHSF